MYTRTDLIQERDSLQRQWRQSRKNLHRLEEQAAMHGSLNVPVYILSGIDDFKEKIEHIEVRLREIEAQLESMPAEPGPSAGTGPTIGVEARPQPGQRPVPAEEKSSQPTVFISYSQKDEAEKEALVSHLGVLQGAGLIETWVDDRIGAGSDWAAEIDRAMSRAKVAILLITANSLTSEFILGTEVPRLLERRQHEGLVVFPVIARHCAWRKVEWLARMGIWPKRGAPVWREGGRYADKELAAIAEEVADIIARAS